MIKNGIIFLFFISIIFSCKEKVQEFSGFTQKEMEYLLASQELKIWQRISREENEEEIMLEGCDLENYLFFVQGQVGNPKPLLYAYNPSSCDSLEFCNLHPELCIADTTFCGEDPQFCNSLGDGILYIGSWYAKEPFIENSRADTLVFEINGITESVQVLEISSEYASFLYKNRTGNAGGSVVENYQNIPLTE